MTPTSGAPYGAGNLEAREISVAGHALRCQVCDFPRFYRKEAELTTGAAFFGQDWTNSKADCFVCEQCGFVHWFVRTRTASHSVVDGELAAEIEELRQRLEATYEESLETANT
ncbi:MAG: hypothetical protein WD826_03025 [Actinomycetota bacterium]